MPKSSEITQIEFIKNHLRKGEKRKSILGKFGKKWENVSRTTFDRRLRLAEESLKIENENISLKTQTLVADEIHNRKMIIMDAMERKEWLTKIIMKDLKVMKVGGSTQMVHEYTDKDGKVLTEIISYDHKLKALSELNKMEGDYAPTKVANTDSKGNDIKSATDEQFEKLLNAAKNAKTSRRK